MEQVHVNKTRNITLCAMFVALIAIGAFLRIPTPLVPITLQVFFTTMAGLLLGGRLGATAVTCYIALGLLGLPIFTQGGGFSYIFQTSFGYIIGFAVGAWVTGTIAHAVPAPSFKRLLGASLLGLAVVQVIGTAYFYVITNFYLHAPMALWPILVHGLFMTLPGDVVLFILAAMIAKRLIPILKRNGWC